MYRVLIVDDEQIIRIGIESIIDWERENMKVHALCANGEEALVSMENCTVDILITDIKMPLMNGIQLMNKALELNPMLKVILLSSYSDFEYVREGLKLGAVDYLLKAPLKPEDLRAVLLRCISMLNEECKKEAELNHYQQGACYRERKSIEQEIKRLIVQEQVPLSSTDWAPVWLELRYDCVYLMLDRAGELRENDGDLHVQLLLEDLQKLFYERMDEGIAMLLPESSMFLVFSENAEDTPFRLRLWKQSVEAELGISTSIGCRTVQGISRILDGFADSRMACQKRFFEGLGGIHLWEAPNEGWGTAITSQHEPETPDKKSFYEIISNQESVFSTVEYVLKLWRSGGSDPEQVKKEACELLSGAYYLQADAASLLPERLDLLRRTETLDQMASLLARDLEEIGKPIIPRLDDNGNGRKLIMKALEYIADHYTENLTLKSVADTVHVSKSYFSLLFKKKTGRNFVDYLIELRIREAKRLLAESDERIYSVAEASGFNDGRYFSKLFKKMTGLTPMEYREKHKSLGSPVD